VQATAGLNHFEARGLVDEKGRSSRSSAGTQRVLACMKRLTQAEIGPRRGASDPVQRPAPSGPGWPAAQRRPTGDQPGEPSFVKQTPPFLLCAPHPAA